MTTGHFETTRTVDDEVAHRCSFDDELFDAWEDAWQHMVDEHGWGPCELGPPPRDRRARRVSSSPRPREGRRMSATRTHLPAARLPGHPSGPGGRAPDRRGLAPAVPTCSVHLQVRSTMEGLQARMDSR